MGHRMEIYVDISIAEKLINISESYGIEAKIVGRVESAKSACLELHTEYGEFVYEK